MPAPQQGRPLTAQRCRETRARGRSPPAQRLGLRLAGCGAWQGDLPRPQLSRTRQGRLAARQHSEIPDDFYARPHLARAARATDHPAHGVRDAHEAELIFIVGKRAKHLTTANAYSCIAGYSCGNEGSVREFQRKTTQWAMG